MYCFGWGDSKIHFVAPGTNDEKTKCGAKIMKTLSEDNASGQLCDDCQSEQVIADEDNDLVSTTPTRMDEITQGTYLYLKHRHGGEVYCVREIETAENLTGSKIIVLHCSRGLTLTGTASETVQVISQYHDKTLRS